MLLYRIRSLDRRVNCNTKAKKESSVKDLLDSRFFTQLFVPQAPQIAPIAKQI